MKRECQSDLHSHLSQYAEKPSHMSGSKIKDDFNNQTYGVIYLNRI